MNIETLLLFALATTALCFLPGPAVLYVFSQGVAHGRASSVAANLGIVAGNTVYFILSALGLGAMILASQELFLAIKWGGAAYLIWAGLRMLFAESSALPDGTSAPVPTGRIFSTGAIVQLSNPKNLVFFLAILPQFIDVAGDLVFQVVVLGVITQAIEFAVLLFYGALGGSVSHWARAPRFARWRDRLAGSLLIGIGASIALVRRARAH